MSAKVAIALFRGLMEGMRMITEAIYRTANPYQHNDTDYWYNVAIAQAVEAAQESEEKA